MATIERTTVRKSTSRSVSSSSGSDSEVTRTISEETTTVTEEPLRRRRARRSPARKAKAPAKSPARSSSQGRKGRPSKGGSKQGGEIRIIFTGKSQAQQQQRSRSRSAGRSAAPPAKRKAQSEKKPAKPRGPPKQRARQAPKTPSRSKSRSVSASKSPAGRRKARSPSPRPKRGFATSTPQSVVRERIVISEERISSPEVSPIRSTPGRRRTPSRSPRRSPGRSPRRRSQSPRGPRKQESPQFFDAVQGRTGKVLGYRPARVAPHETGGVNRIETHTTETIKTRTIEKPGAGRVPKKMQKGPIRF